MMLLAKIHSFVEKGYGVTVIGPSPQHYYSGMGPGMLGGTYRPEEIRFETQHVVEKQGGRFIVGKAAGIDPNEKTVCLASGDVVPYDVVSFNAGSHVPELATEGSTENIYTVKPIEKLQEARDRIETILADKPLAIGVIGGGPSSAEVAGKVLQLAQKAGRNGVRIRIFSSSRFMKSFPEGIRKRALTSLKKRNIEVLEHIRVKEIRSSRVILESGNSHELDFIFLALGVKPSGMFRDAGLPVGPDGGLRVNAFLQCIDYPDIFGGGDCIYFQDQPLDKVGVYAVRENPILLQNLMARLEGRDLQPFDPGGDYLLIFNMGGGTGILQKRWLTFGGKLAFRIKDYIDRKFMARFQAME